MHINKLINLFYFYAFYLVLSNKIGTFAAENGTGSVTYPLFLFL